MERPRETGFRAALSRAAARVTGSRFAKPLARAALTAAGVALLAVLGRTAGALSAWPAPAIPGPGGPPPLASFAPPAPPTSAEGGRAAAPTTSTTVAQAAGGDEVAARLPATADDPVVLNAASESDLRRLPGIGAKRASAILALRARLGRFRALEDLLKVKGIGRATLKRLRPLVRLDPPAADAGPLAGRAVEPPSVTPVRRRPPSGGPPRAAAPAPA